MDKRISVAMRLIERQVADTVDFEEIARAVGLSHHRFHHLFVEQSGETPGGFLRRIRLDLAAMRLRWTSERVGDIAHGFGYRSQASFTHAFMARFGATPSRFRRDFTRWPNKPIDGITDRRITVRECEPVHCLARRYFGPYRNVPENWIDFVARLPTDLKSHGLFFGLTYDDPRFTPADQIRYDCCVTLGRGPLEDEDVLTSKGFHRLATRPGLYAAVEHRGCYATGIGSSYSLILDHWGANNPRHTIGDDPGIEIYTTPPGIGAPETLVGTITVPLV